MKLDVTSGRLTVTAGKAAEQFVQVKASKACRQRYLAKLERTMRLFLPNRRDLPVAELGPDAVEEFLGRNCYRPATRKSHRSNLGSFFFWCVRKGYRDDNPVHPTEAPILDDKAPGMPTASEVRDLIEATQRQSPRLRPRIRLPKDLGFLPGQTFAHGRTAGGVLLRPRKPEPSKAKSSGGKHLRRKGGNWGLNGIGSRRCPSNRGSDGTGRS